ncbi:MAG: MFS transporter [Thermodesulfobacteriota bacterium]
MIQAYDRTKDKLFYGWVVVIAFLMINVIIQGTRHSFGVFFKSLSGEFGLSRTETSGIYSIYSSLCCLFSFVSGWGADRMSLRMLIGLMGLFTGLSLILTSQAQSLGQLFLLYSFLFAMGTSGVFVVSTSIIIRWFNRKRGLAIGIATSGQGLGTALLAPLAAYLIAVFDWRMSYIVMGMIVLLFVIPMAMLLRKEPGEMGLLPYGAELSEDQIGGSHRRGGGHPPGGSSLLDAFKSRNFWCLGFVWLLFSMCLYLVMTHIVPHGTDSGIPTVKAATVLGVIGVMSIPGRLLVGKISDHSDRKAVAIICELFVTGTMVWLIYSKSLWMFYLFALVFGFFYGGLSTSVTALIGDIFGQRSIGVILGALEVGWFLGASLGPLMGGIVYDMTKNYSMAFSISVLASMVVTLLLALTKREVKVD